YRAARGPAVPVAGDPWPALDVPARALTVQTAARMIVKSAADGRPLDEVEQCVVDACARIAAVPAAAEGELAPGGTTSGATDRSRTESVLATSEAGPISEELEPSCSVRSATRRCTPTTGTAYRSSSAAGAGGSSWTTANWSR